MILGRQSVSMSLSIPRPMQVLPPGTVRRIHHNHYHRTFFSISKHTPSSSSLLSDTNVDELTLEEIKKLAEMDEEEMERLQELEESDSGSSSAQHAWRVLLEPAARAAWRTSEQTPPIHWSERRHGIIEKSELTLKQLKRSHQKILESQKALQERRERERRREKLSRRGKPDSLAEKHDNARDSTASAVYYKPDFTLATLQHRLLPNLAIIKRVLEETQALLPNFKPKRVIDFGIGVGSASAAAIDIYPDIEWIHGIDPSRSMRECAERVLENRGQRVTTDPSLSTKSVKGTFDLVLFAFTATDLPHIAATMAAAAVLWEKLNPNGVFVMIEPGTPDGFSNIRSVRSMLLDCCPPESDADDDEEDDLVLDQCHVIAPCTHNGVCPMERHRRKIWPDKSEGSDEEVDTTDNVQEAEWTEDGDDRFGAITDTAAFESSFCSFVHNIPGATNTAKGDKLCYFVAQKRYPTSETIDQPLFPNLADLLAETYRSSNDRDPINHEIMLYEADQAKEKFEDMADNDPLGLSILVGDKNRQSFGRIVRAPLKRKGHVMVDYCAVGTDGSGKIVRHRLGKLGSAKVAPGQYAAARKARWGGLWPHIIDKIQ